LLTLDVNHDGVVDQEEVATFARAQGLDIASVTQEFSEIDRNADGRLDASEISQALAIEAAGAATEVPTSVSGQATSTPQAAAAATSALNSASAHAASIPHAAVVGATPPTQAAAADTSALNRASAHAASIPQAVGAITDASVSTGARAIAAEAAANEAMLQPSALTASSHARIKKRKAKAPQAIALNSTETLVATTVSAKQDLAAGSMAWELSQDEAREEDARRLEERSYQLRSNASAIAKAAAEKALQAGAKAAKEQTLEVLQRVQELEDGAQKADVTAAALQKKSQEELEEAGRLMAVADAALQTAGM
jgi:hypothetical protein